MVLTWNSHRSNPHMQRKQTIDDCKLCVIMQNTQGKSIEAGNWNLFNTFYSSLCWWEPFQRSSCVEKLVPCIVTLAHSLAVCLGSLSCWNLHPHLIFICLCTFFLSSFLQLCEACQYCMLKNNPTLWRSHLQTLLLVWCVRVICSDFWPPSMVCIQRV